MFIIVSLQIDKLGDFHNLCDLDWFLLDEMTHVTCFFPSLFFLNSSLT